LYNGVFLDRRRDVVIALADTLVAADFGVLALTLLHQRLEFRIIRLGDRLGRHLDDEVTAGRFDACPDVDDGLLQSRNAGVLVEAGVGEAMADQ
jgi:hypothetical protein